MSQLWSSIIAGSSMTTPVLNNANTVIYVGSTNSKLYAYDASNGTLLWERLTGGAITSSPVLNSANTIIYVGAGDGRLYAYDATGVTVPPLWARLGTVGGDITSSPVLNSDNTVIYVGSTDSKLYAYNAVNGNQVWAPITIDGPIVSTPVLGP